MWEKCFVSTICDWSHAAVLYMVNLECHIVIASESAEQKNEKKEISSELFVFTILFGSKAWNITRSIVAEPVLSYEVAVVFLQIWQKIWLLPFSSKLTRGFSLRPCSDFAADVAVRRIIFSIQLDSCKLASTFVGAIYFSKGMMLDFAVLL